MMIARSTIALAVFAFGAVSMAKVTFSKDFDATYGVKKSTALGKAKCATCHIGMAKKLNPYGIDLQKAMRQENTKLLTGSVLKKVEGLDSDKDEKNNLDEIRAGTLPGDSKSS